MESFLSSIASWWKPHAGQLDFLSSPERVKILACGRRWGKTEVCAVECAHQLTSERSSRQLLVAPTLYQARLLFDRVIRFLERLPELGDLRRAIRYSPFPRLTLGPHEVVARSGHRPDSLRGEEATRIIVDEAAFVDDRLIAEALWPMLATTDGAMILMSTPQGLNPFWRLFQRGQQGEVGVYSRRAPSAENPFVSPTFLANQRALISERAYAVEYEATFIETEGAVFREEAIQSAISDDLPAATGPFFIGIDFARFQDFTVAVVLSGDRDACQIVEIERFHRIAWSVQLDRLAALIGRYPEARVLCDQSSIGDPLLPEISARVSRHAVTGYKFTAVSKPILVEGLAALFERGGLRFRPDPVLLRELRAFRETGGRSGGGAEHDDVVIALALAAFQLPTNHGPRVRVGRPRT